MQPIGNQLRFWHLWQILDRAGGDHHKVIPTLLEEKAVVAAREETKRREEAKTWVRSSHNRV